MNNFLKILFLLISLILLVLAVIFALGFFKPQKAGLSVETVPAATVYINGIQSGKTPFETTRNTGEIALKLVPEAKDKILVPFENKVLLTAGTKTVVRRYFAETESLSSGEIVTLEKVGGEASLAVVADPDSAQVSVDGASRGFAPYKTGTITPAEHQIAVAAPGYLTKTINVNTLSGYLLTAIIKLAPDLTAPTPSVALKASPTPNPEIILEILTTPNGFLRVREEPNTEAKELGRVNPGEKYTLVEEDSQSGWYKIEYLTGQFGWISGEFVKKL